MTRSFSNSASSAAKVAVLGAAGGIGQPLSMLLKLSNEVDELSCYDIVGTPGVAADLSHVSAKELRFIDEEFLLHCIIFQLNIYFYFYRSQRKQN